jgi:hypothetical protein
MIIENKYHPFTEAEFNEMKTTLEGITSYLPDNLLSYVWNKYRIISGNVSENQPCSCASAGGLWVKAVNTIKDYIKEKETL